MSTDQIIVVGAGKWGSNIIKTVYDLGHLRAIVESDKTTFQNAQQKFESFRNISWHSTLHQAIISIPKASVIIATPPRTHYQLAQTALMAGRHVFVEKPLCQKSQDSKSLVCLASTRRCILMVDHLLRYNAPHRILHRLIQAGFVGKVNRVRMTRLNFGTVRTHENVLWSLSPHDVSVLLGIMDDQLPEAISANGQKIVSSDIEDHATVTLHFKRNVIAQIEASWLHPEKERRTFVYGNDGVLILNEHITNPNQKNLEGYRWSATKKEDGSAILIEKSEADLMKYLRENELPENVEENDEQKPPLECAIKHFTRCISQGIEPITDGNEGHRVVTVLEAASASLAKKGELVSVPNREVYNIMIHETAIVEPKAKLGKGTKVWHFSHIMDGAVLGNSCNIGQNVYIGGKAKLGCNVKVQNNVSIYDAVTIDDDVFLGPSCVLTNVKTPRSHVNRKNMYQPTVIGKGATVGANATIVCGVTLGEYCFVGAGSVVTKNILPYALVYGNPATQKGWVSKTGANLKPLSSKKCEGLERFKCPESGEVYCLVENDDKIKKLLPTGSCP